MPLSRAAGARLRTAYLYPVFPDGLQGKNAPGLVSAFALVSPDNRAELIQYLVDLGAPYNTWFSVEA